MNDVTDNQLQSLSDVFLEAGIDPYGKENHLNLIQDHKERKYWAKEGLVKFGLENTMRLVRGGNFEDWDSVKEEK